MVDSDDRVETAERAASVGGAHANSLFREELRIEQKENARDLVTRADRETQERVLDRIREDYPDEPIVGEEGDQRKTVPESGPAWIVDPIDGTNNYVRGIHVWSCVVASVVDGDPVAAAVDMPALGETYVAGPDGAVRDGDPISVSDRENLDELSVAPTVYWGIDRREVGKAAAAEIIDRFGDIARFRCAQATLTMVAAGALDATFTERTPNPWDAVAGAYLIEQAGGTVTDLDGDPWQHDSEGLVASNGRCHDEVLAAARAVADVADR